MGEQSSENYLDQLLDSVDEGDNKIGMPEDVFADIDTKGEDDFLQEFEAELAGEENDVSVQEADVEPFMDEQKEQDVNASVDDLLERMSLTLEDAPEPLPDEPEPEEAGKAVAEEENLEMPREESGEVDLSGAGDSDLMDMLSGDADLSELGSMLAGDSEGITLESEDAIGSFAEAEMKVREEEETQEKEAEEEKKGKKKKKEKKEKPEQKEGGFLQRLSKILFGEDEDEKIMLGGADGTDVIELSAENQQILQEMDSSDAKEQAKAKKAEKKKEKEKKKKEKQDAKAKKPKKQKPPKPKKEKKPKEKDNTPPLPKGPVIAIVVMVGSLFAFVMLGTNLLGYQSHISAAKDKYKAGDYVEAYSNLQGLEVKKKDEELYNKLSVLAAVSEKYQDYLLFGEKISRMMGNLIHFKSRKIKFWGFKHGVNI